MQTDSDGMSRQAYTIHSLLSYVINLWNYISSSSITLILDVDVEDVDVEDLWAQANISMPASYIANYIYSLFYW